MSHRERAEAHYRAAGRYLRNDPCASKRHGAHGAVGVSCYSARKGQL